MKKLKVLALVGLTVGFSSVSLASEVDVLCKKSSDCGVRIVAALEKMGCAPIAESLNCNISANPQEDPAHDYCGVQTEFCDEPRSDLVFTTHCDSGSPVSFRKYDQGLSLSWWMGFGGSYISYVCKK